MASAIDNIYKQYTEIAGLRADLAKSQELQQTVRGMLGAEIDCIRQQRERLRAKLDRLEDAADEDAATIFSLRAELAATDQKWRDVVAELVGVDMILTERKADARQDAEKIERLERCLGFFASVIKSGESWTETCEREYRAALACRPHTPSHGPFPGAPFSPPKGD